MLVAVANPCVARGEETIHRLRSPRQVGETTVRVFVPDHPAPGSRRRLLLVLPVEAADETRWGDPAAEIRRTDLANNYELIVALPTFSDLPWYADHPASQCLRQESYILGDVLPLLDREYDTDSSAGETLLVGFSKSGWGAWSLLLRHPSLFARAAAWDAPLMQAKPDQYGMGPIFGTQQNFETYRVSELVRRRADLLRGASRLVLTGYFGAFRAHHVAMHKLLEELELPHEYRDGPQRAHHWESGWLDEAVSLLVQR